MSVKEKINNSVSNSIYNSITSPVFKVISNSSEYNIRFNVDRSGFVWISLDNFIMNVGVFTLVSQKLQKYEFGRNN